MNYDTGAISLLERDEQGWRLKDMNAFAAVDPLKRGAPWLGFGVAVPPAGDMQVPTPNGQLLTIDLSKAVRITPEQEDAILARAEKDRREREQAARKPTKKVAGKRRQ